ncbi:class II peroxidase [Aulographum hederae CBS 113979]|uniref:Peroxidase n=1 Tax=Aulographum hederae CBS 113979 TaxID=1176131 RepID=A0A6G1GTG5_9PEZI|nr:class II peroxidase [Aulographum hederae CBS 113979]
MKTSTLLVGYALATALPGTLAWPGMTKTMADLKSKLSERQDSSGEFDSDELIGDLATVGATTAVGKAIKDIILGDADPESDVKLSGTLPAKGSKACAADTCCVWKYIANDMAAKFKGSSGRCNKFARAAVRLGFHDAGAWSKQTGGTGADGSIILASGEINRAENKGLQDIAKITKAWYDSYKKYGVSAADVIQMGANVATVVCPLGPRVRSFVGRKDSTTPAVDGLLPNVFADADSLIQLFKDKTIKQHGLTALVGAHTTSQQLFVDPSRARDPQDSTPGVWDVLFYGQTLSNDVPKRVFKFPSDVKLSQHPDISAEWQKFVNDQGDWNEDYAREYVRLSLLGVNNINSLTECTAVLPPAVKAFKNPDNTAIAAWLKGKFNVLGSYLEDGTLLSSTLLTLLGILLG